MCFLAFRHFFLLRPRIFPRALGSVARWEPARTPHASLGPGRGPWHVLWGFKVARPLGDGFRARRAVQAPANPRTRYSLKDCPTAHVIFGILNVNNVVRHYLRGDRKVFRRHQHARHATTFNTIRKISMASEGYYRSLLTHMTTRWLGLFTCDPRLYEYNINN